MGDKRITYGTSAEKYLQTESQFQGVNNWSHTIGNHNIRFGGDIRFALNHLVGVNNNNLLSGQFEFPGAVTAATGSQGVGFATFLLGDVNTFFRTVIQNTAAAERQKRWFFYGQDQWRVTQTLTLNYGLRWELYFPESVAGKGQGGLLDLSTGNVRIAGYGPYGNNLNVNMEYTHLAPRVGIAWQWHSRTPWFALVMGAPMEWAGLATPSARSSLSPTHGDCPAEPGRSQLELLRLQLDQRTARL